MLYPGPLFINSLQEFLHPTPRPFVDFWEEHHSKIITSFNINSVENIIEEFIPLSENIDN